MYTTFIYTHWYNMHRHTHVYTQYTHIHTQIHTCTPIRVHTHTHSPWLSQTNQFNFWFVTQSERASFTLSSLPLLYDHWHFLSTQAQDDRVTLQRPGQANPHCQLCFLNTCVWFWVLVLRLKAPTVGGLFRHYPSFPPSRLCLPRGLHMLPRLELCLKLCQHLDAVFVL